MTIAIFASPAGGGATARGRALGAAWRAEVQQTWAAYQRFFAVHGLDEALIRDVGERALDNVAAWAPQFADEIAGIAEGAGLAPWEAAALNARSEVLAHSRRATPGECSTAVYLPGAAPPRTIQTWDWHDEMSGVKLLWQYEPGPGRTVKTFTEFGILGKIGVTSQGLGLHFNLLQHETDGKQDGVPVHLIARRILDEAATLGDAAEIIQSARASASVALTVVTYDGNSSQGCIFEVSPAGVARLPLRPDRFLLHTNHFLDPALSAGERLAVADPDTCARQRELERRTDALSAADIGGRAAALIQHREDGAALCCHPSGEDPVEGHWQTLLVIGLELDRGRLACRDGNPCAAAGQGWVRF